MSLVIELLKSKMKLRIENNIKNLDLNSIEIQIEKVEKEVRDFALLLKNTIGNNDEITNLLLGWKIFYSPIIINPKILFIGINPGGGDPGGPFEYYNEEYAIIEYMDDERNNYMLAKNTKKIFNKNNQLYLLQNAVKLNTKFYATVGIGEMKLFEDFLYKNHRELYNQLIQNNKKWTKEIIEIINPENIICEGKSAFNFMDDLYDDGDNWTKTLDYDTNKYCGNFKRKSDGMNLFGYTRRIGLSDEELLNNIAPELLKIVE